MTHYTSANFSGLTPFPVVDNVGNPYNYTSTPIIGLPNISSLPQAFLQYCNNTGIWAPGSTPVSGVVATTVTSGGQTTTTYTYPGQGLPSVYAASGAAVDSTGNPTDTTKILLSGGAGTADECNPEFIAHQWQAFFYVFQPYITDAFFQTVQNSLADSTVIESNVSYYTGLFQKSFVEWMRYRKTNPSSSNGSSFVTYLQNNTDMGYRQRSVIFWQLSRVIDMLTQLEPRAINSAQRSVIWNQAAAYANAAIASTNIPSLSNSDEDVRVPDPGSIDAQNTVMMRVEQYRANLNIDQENARTEDANISFSGDGISQQRATLDSFWASLSTILQSVIN